MIINNPSFNSYIPPLRGAWRVLVWRALAWRVFLLLLCLFAAATAQAAEKTDSDGLPPVVIVSSYNPDVGSVSTNLQEFYDEYHKENTAANPIAIEDISALNLPDSRNWKVRLWDRLKKYYENGQRPACIVLLGNEASAAFFSIEDERFKTTPVVVGMRSCSIVKLPRDMKSLDLQTWEPTVSDLTKDFKDWNIVGGRLYRYDVKKNLDLILHFYPACRHLMFLSDNTLGGVTMKALFKREVEKAKQFEVTYIDGRKLSFLDVNEILTSQTVPNTALVCGTWRIDDSNRYIVRKIGRAHV